MYSPDVEKVVLAIVVSLPAFCAGHLLSVGEPGAALELALATALTVVLAAAIAHRPRSQRR